MSLNVAKELAVLQRMTPAELRVKYAEAFGEQSRSGHKAWLVKRIIWRLQANSEGDLSERARRRALEIANDADLRLKAPAVPRRTSPAPERTVVAKLPAAKGRVPSPGTVLTRAYKGRTLQVAVLADGFEFEGDVFTSLSAVAKAVTGSHLNGFQFFRLGQYGGGA